MLVDNGRIIDMTATLINDRVKKRQFSSGVNNSTYNNIEARKI